nr:unnamed protein product [Callosobruchus chinensis]
MPLNDSQRFYAPPGSFVTEDSCTGQIIPGSWRQITASDTGVRQLRKTPRNASNAAKAIREEFMEFFISPQEKDVVKDGFRQRSYFTRMDQRTTILRLFFCQLAYTEHRLDVQDISLSNALTWLLGASESVPRANNSRARRQISGTVPARRNVYSCLGGQAIGYNIRQHNVKTV